MKVARRLYHLARADFLERVRRTSFLVTLLACVYAGYAFLPPNPSRYATLVMDGHRGVYNSAWIGTAVSILAAAFMSLIGFFLVKNTIARDRQTRVGQILATTPIARVQYTLGKSFSNFAVLAAMTLVVAVAVGVMQLVRGEDPSIDPYRLLAPFVLITLPALMMTAGVAVFFETIPGLRGGLGNVLYVFVWGFMLGGNFDRNLGVLHNDPLGSGIALPGMLAACHAAFPAFDPATKSVSMGVNFRSEGEWLLTTFPWNGIDWNARIVAWRLSWVLVGLGIASIAAIPFDRFDPSRGRGDTARVSKQRRRGWRRARTHDDDSSFAESAAHAVHLTPLDARAFAARPFAIVVAEWKLLTKGLRAWYVGPLAVAIASCFVPLAPLRAIVLPLAWLWPVLLWSKLGTREAHYDTQGILFSAPHPLSRQLPATWLAGVALALLAAAPIGVRLLIAGELGAFGAWLVGAAFIPALAIALAVWTGSGKFFEALFACLWYAIVQRAVPLDFMGATPEGVARGNPAVFAVLTVLLLALAAFGRRRVLRR